MKENVVVDKSLAFAIRIGNLSKYLRRERREFIMSDQTLRSGTSIGANVREAINGASKADFIHKLTIAQKECDETIYWLRLLKEGAYLSEREYLSINKGACELLAIIRSIIISSRANSVAR